MKKIFAVLLFLGIAALTFGQDGYKTLQKKNVTVKYKYDNRTISFIIEAKTTGWVSLAIDPQKVMKDADIIIGYVKNGITYVSDEYGKSYTSHASDTSLGGTDDIITSSGSEVNGVTTLYFTISRKSKDKYDKKLTGRKYKIFVATGAADNFKSKHNLVVGFELILSGS